MTQKGIVELLIIARMSAEGFMQLKSKQFILVCAMAGLSASLASAAQVIIKTNQGIGADAEIREQNPEDARGGFTTVDGPQTELATRSTGGQHTGFLMRFDLTGVTPATIAGFADLRLTFRGNNTGGTANSGTSQPDVNGLGFRIYGVKSNAPLTATWNELTVKYRDAGSAVQPSTGPALPTPNPLAQPSPGARTGAPVAPVSLTDPTWGSNPADPDRAPGIVHESAPYSANVESLNQSRYAANVALYNADIADDGLANSSNSTAAYQAYVNQQGYNATSFTGNYTDTVNKPLTTYNADADPSLTTFLGFLDMDGRTTPRAPGTELSFSTTDDGSVISHGAADAAANNAALVAYLTQLLNDGATSATIMVFQKNQLAVTGDADPGPVRSDNIVFASKEFAPKLGPDTGVVGAWAPKLVLGVVPEPTSLSALALGSLVMGRRRKA